jgi:glycosidase
MKKWQAIIIISVLLLAIFPTILNSTLTAIGDVDATDAKNGHTIVRMRDPLTHFSWAPEIGETQPANVSLVGEWDWDTHTDLSLNSTSQIWTTGLNLSEGMYCYKFVIGESDYRFDPVNNYRGYCGQFENSVVRVDNKSKPIFTVELNESTGLPERVLYHAGIGGGYPQSGGLSYRGGIDDVQYSHDNSEMMDPATWAIYPNISALSDGKWTLVFDGTDSDGIRVERLSVSFWKGPQQDFTWDDALIYMVMTDRFVDGNPTVGNLKPGGTDFDGDGFTNDCEALWGTDPREGNSFPAQGELCDTGVVNWVGGDFRGVRQMITNGYFTDLGVNALWLSPFNTAANGWENASDGQHKVSGYHGYWPTEPRGIDPRFGDEEDLWQLVSAAHGAGIRVMGDFVVNHVHEDHPYYQNNPEWFNEGCICGEPECDWTEERLECLFTDYMPDLNWKNRNASEQMIEDALWWMYTFDLDGARIDAVKHVDDLAITNLAIRINEEFEVGGTDYYLKGETAMGWAGHDLAANQPQYDMINRYIGNDSLDGQADFVLYHAVVDNVFTSGNMDYQHLDYWTNRSTDQYVDGATMVPFIGSHDSPRFISRADPGTSDAWNQWSEDGLPGQPGTQEPYDTALQAFAWLLTTPGAPMIYMGDEYGEFGGADPDNRHMLRNASEQNSREAALLENVSELSQLRKNLEPLRRGNYTTLSATSDTLAYARQTTEGATIVMLNRAQTSQNITVDLASLSGNWSRPIHLDLFGNNNLVNGDVTLPANSVAVYHANFSAPDPPPPTESDSHCLEVQNLTVNSTLAIGLDLVNICDIDLNYPGVAATADNSGVSGFFSGLDWYYIIFANDTIHYDWQLILDEQIPNGTLVTLTFAADILNCGPTGYHDCPNSTLTHEFTVTWPGGVDPPGNETENQTGNNTGNNTGNETTEPPFDVSNITASGPFEFGFHPRNRTPAEGIMLDACQLGTADRERLGLAPESELQENDTLLCGAMVVKVSQPDGCWVEQWIDNEGMPLTNSWVNWRDICPENPAWAASHEGISEKPLPLNAEELVSRLDPDYQVGDAIAFPGIMCDSTNIWLSKRPGSNGGTVHENDTILSHWACVDNSTNLQENTTPEDDGNSQTTTVCTDGDTKPAEDGCNTCTCDQDNWSCTEIGCEPVIDDANDAEGGFNFFDFARAGLIGMIVLGLITFALLSLRRRQT